MDSKLKRLCKDSWKDSYVVGFAVAGVLVSLACSMWLNKPVQILQIVISICLIILYALCSSKKYSKDADSDFLLSSADHAYLLGYLYTLAALFGLALGYNINRYSKLSDELIMFAAVKLSTTLVGITAMLALKVHAYSLSSKQPELPDISTLVKDKDFFANITALVQSNMRLADMLQKQKDESFEKFKGFAAGLNITIDTFINNTNGLSGNVKTLTADVGALTTTVSTLKKEIDDADSGVIKTFNSLRSGADTATATIKQASDKCKEYSNTVETAIKKTNNLKTNIREMGKVLDDFVEGVKPTVDKGDDIRNNIDALKKELGKKWQDK